MNTDILRSLSYGVYVVSTLDKDRPTGCIVNSTMQINSSPATLAISVNRDNFTHKCIKETNRFGISILSVKCDPSLIGLFGFQSGEKVNKFHDVPFMIQSLVPVLNDSCGYVVCKVIDTLENGSHTIFLGEMIDGNTLKDEIPMTYRYYHEVIRGKAPKTAPTYLPE